MAPSDFRNLGMKTSHLSRGIFGLALALGLAASSQLAAEDAVKLFNGKDLSGWQGAKERWSVEDGAITGKTTPESLLNYNTFLIWEGGTPANFELRLKYRIVNGNSGVQYRSKVTDQEKFVVGGYQADIDSTPRYSGILYEERGRGILAERGQKVRINEDGSKDVIGSLGDRDALQTKINNEQWNDYLIVADGNHLKHVINGVTMSEVVDEQSDKAASQGVIALQLHAGPAMTVQFKDIELKELK
jgi:hypothetical protein